MPSVIFDAPDFHHSKHRPKDWCFDKDSNQSYTPSVSPTPRFNGSRHRHEVKLLEQDQSANHVNILESMAGYTRTRNNSQFADRSPTSHKDVEYSPEVDEDAERLETEPSVSRKLVGQRVNTTIVRHGKSSEKKASDTISYNQRHAKYITQEAGNHSDYDSSSALGDYFIGSECSPRGDSDESALGELFIIDSPDHMVVNNSPSASNSVLGDLFSSESNSANNSDVDSTLGELFVDSDSLAPPNALQLYNDASASEDNSVRLGDLFSESGDIDNPQVDNDETNTTLGKLFANSSSPNARSFHGHDPTVISSNIDPTCITILRPELQWNFTSPAVSTTMFDGSGNVNQSPRTSSPSNNQTSANPINILSPSRYSPNVLSYYKLCQALGYHENEIDWEMFENYQRQQADVGGGNSANNNENSDADAEGDSDHDI